MKYWLLLVLLALGTCVSAGDIDNHLNERGFVNLNRFGDMFVIDLMYGRDDNFVGEKMYEGLDSAWLHPKAAKALFKASCILEKERPDLRIKVCDATRPMSVQRKMYDKVRHTSKVRYVSNPANGGGLHNYGLAVDVTLCDSDGIELHMGTPVDYLGPESNIDREERLVATGKLSSEELANRKLLRRVMKQAGFRPLRSEWWHFNLVSRAVAKASYLVVE